MTEHIIKPEVWYKTADVLELLGVTRKQLRRLGIRCTPLTRGKDLYLGADLIAWLTAKRNGVLPLRRVS